MTDIQILLSRLAAPARRAIQAAQIASLEELAQMSEAEIAGLHGIGKHALKTIHAVLSEHGLRLADEDNRN